jgi:hypothetical protein
MPNRIRATAPRAALLAALAACGPMHRSGPEPQPAIVIFTNDSVDLAELYAVHNGTSPIRLGSVEAGRTAELKVPMTALGGDGLVSFTARIFARPRVEPTSGEISLREGERVTVRLPVDLRILSILRAP